MSIAYHPTPSARPESGWNIGGRGSIGTTGKRFTVPQSVSTLAA